VLIVERWLIGRVRDRRFYSLAELNAAIGELLHRLNEERPIRRHPCLRYDLSPMCPGWTLISLVPQEGFEPPTPSLRNTRGIAGQDHPIVTERPLRLQIRSAAQDGRKNALWR
jgi:hypothetical protein